jgi:hypothetical protein
MRLSAGGWGLASIGQTVPLRVLLQVGARGASASASASFGSAGRPEVPGFQGGLLTAGGRKAT